MIYNKRDVRARLRELLRVEIDDAMDMKGTKEPDLAEAMRNRSNTLWWVLYKALGEVPRERLFEIVQRCGLEKDNDAVLETGAEDWLFIQSYPVQRKQKS